MELKTAFLYDFLQVPGGAEQVALHLARVFPDMDCTCAFVEAGVFPQPSVNAERFRTLTSPTGIVGWQSIKAIRAFERKTGFLKDFDAVIYSGLYAPVAIRNQGSGVS